MKKTDKSELALNQEAAIIAAFFASGMEG
jgi:hypothetical protein